MPLDPHEASLLRAYESATRAGALRGVGGQNAQDNRWYEPCVQNAFVGRLNTPGSFWGLYTSWNGFGLRVVIPQSVLTYPKRTSQWVRVWLDYGPLLGSGTLYGAYIGHQDSSVNPWNFTGDQKQLKFRGATQPAVAGASYELISDPVLFTYADNSPLVISFRTTGVTINYLYGDTTQPDTSCDVYFVGGADSTKIADTTIASMNKLIVGQSNMFIKMIEVSS